MLAKSWNNSIDKLQTYSTNAISYDSGMLREVEKQWKATAQRANYHEVKADGSLGAAKNTRWKKNNAEAIQEASMAGITPVDGGLGIEVWINGKQYQATGLPFNDPAMQVYGEIVQFDAPFMGKEGIVGGLGGIPIGKRGEEIVYAPEGTKMRVTLDDNLNRIGELIGPDGRKIMTLDDKSIRNIQADYTRTAAAEVSRGVNFSSQWYQQMDPNRVGDY